MTRTITFNVLLLSYLIHAVSCNFSSAQGQQYNAPVNWAIVNDGLNSHTRNPQQSSDHKWQPATYRGLTVGTSTREDLLRLFGNPKRKDSPMGQIASDPEQTVWYIYETGGEFTGQLTFIIDIRSEKIIEINLSPEKLSKKEAINRLGNDYLITSYDFCTEGFEYEEAGPVYESNNGALSYIEYRSRGIALHIDGTEKVNEISYVSNAIGYPSKDSCRRVPTVQSNSQY